MPQTSKREYHSVEEKITLANLFQTISGEIEVYFGKTTETHPYTDHGCLIKEIEEGIYSYRLEGHAIGSQNKEPASLKDTVNRVFSDCQRFGGGNTVTIVRKNS